MGGERESDKCTKMKPIDIHRKQDLLGRWQVQASPAKKEMMLVANLKPV